jgi:pimeloyl-ACP methyl ester carboxylesterase
MQNLSCCLLTIVSAVSLLSINSTTAKATQQLPSFEKGQCLLQDCSGLEGSEIDWGYLTVAENHLSTSSKKKIKLAVAILRARNKNEKNEAVLFIQGGPGGGAISTIRFWLNHPLREKRDLVLVDLRGTGFSEPKFCPELGREFMKVLGMDLNASDAITAKTDKAKECLDDLKQRNIDLAAYNSTFIASDLELLRTELDYSGWHLYGSSYGTRIALSYMRKYPQYLQSVILDSPITPNCGYYDKNTSNFSRALDVLFKKCKDDPACARSYGNLRDTFLTALTNLEEQPIAAKVSSELSADGRFVFNKEDMLLALHQSLYNPKLFALAPLMITQFKHRNEEVIESLVTSLGSRLSLDYGVFYTILCHETIPNNSIESFKSDAAPFEYAPEGLAFYMADFQICNEWGQGIASGDSAVWSNIPTLIVSGEQDPITPPSNGVLAGTTLANHFYLSLPDFGHNAGFSNCGQKLLAAFVDDPTAMPDTTCFASQPKLAFVTGITLNKAVSKIATSIASGSAIIYITLCTGICLLIAAIGLGVAGRTRDHNKIHGGRYLGETTGRLVAWSSSIIALCFFIFMFLAIDDASGVNTFILAFGIRDVYSPVLLIPYVLVALSIVLLAVLIISWLYSSWNRLTRVFFCFVTLCCWGLILQMAYFGLL